MLRNQEIIGLVIYGVILLDSLYLMLLLLWWWKKVGDASKIYKYTTLLMFGLFALSFAGVERYWLGNLEDDWLVMQWWWSLRLLPIVVALGAYTYYLTHKFWIEYHGGGRNRRHDD